MQIPAGDSGLLLQEFQARQAARLDPEALRLGEDYRLRMELASIRAVQTLNNAIDGKILFKQRGHE